MLFGAAWPSRALIRAQLIEDGFEVVAVDTWVEMRRQLRPGHKPRAAILDLKDLENPSAVLSDLSLLMRPERVLVIAASGAVPLAEIVSYLRELSGPAAAYMRPNFFTNTPDILHEYLQHGGPPAFRTRAVLAAMLSPSWGIYSGYELCENTPVRPGSEEYLDSEKYQYRPRDWARAQEPPSGIAPLITRLNAIRPR